MTDYYVTRQYRDGATTTGHVATDDIEGYIASEDTAVIFPTTVIAVEPCTNWLTCDHRQPVLR